jgi:hypothetical protein
MPRTPPAYPHASTESLLQPVLAALADLMAGRPAAAGPLPGAVPFAEPVAHVSAPAVPAGGDPEDAARRLVEIAYQYGLCQGYALHRSESAERLKTARALEQLSRGLLDGAKKTVARGRRATKPPGRTS